MSESDIYSEINPDDSVSNAENSSSMLSLSIPTSIQKYNTEVSVRSGVLHESFELSSEMNVSG